MKAHTTRMREATTAAGAARAFARFVRQWAEADGHMAQVRCAMCDDKSWCVTWVDGPHAWWTTCLEAVPEALVDADATLCNDHWRGVPDAAGNGMRFYARPQHGMRP